MFQGGKADIDNTDKPAFNGHILLQRLAVDRAGLDRAQPSGFMDYNLAPADQTAIMAEIAKRRRAGSPTLAAPAPPSGWEPAPAIAPAPHGRHQPGSSSTTAIMTNLIGSAVQELYPRSMLHQLGDVLHRAKVVSSDGAKLDDLVARQQALQDGGEVRHLAGC